MENYAHTSACFVTKHRLTKAGLCAYCTQISQLCNLRCALMLNFLRVAQFALRIYKSICVFAICALKNNRANCAISFRLFAKML